MCGVLHRQLHICLRNFRRGSILSDNSMIARRGDIAEAAPAVVGWRMAVHDPCG